MGFISNLFSKKNKNLQTVSNESSTDSKENMSIIDKEGFDYSLLSYDNAGWLTYPDGLKCRNVSQLFCDTFDDRLYDVILDTKEKLGYNDGEVFYIYLDKNGKRLFSYECESTYFVGFWELFTNKFLCFVTLNAHVMNQQEIESRAQSAKQLFQQRMQLVRCMVLPVDFSRNPQCLLRQLVKHHVYIGAT